MERELIFTGRTQEGYEIEFDAHVSGDTSRQTHFSLALQAVAIDVVLPQKMRSEIDDFRNSDSRQKSRPPRYFKAIDMTLARGQGSGPKVDRAIALSHDKYCSVYNSLRKDMDVGLNIFLRREPLKRYRDRIGALVFRAFAC